MKPIRIIFKLKKNAPPHLFIPAIKELMKDDKSLHPMMKRTLILLKKMRQPYIQLAVEKEMIIDSENFRHFERSLNPLGKWSKVYWSDEEIKQHKENPKGHMKEILELYNKLGYESFFEGAGEVSEEYLKEVLVLTSNQPDKKDYK